MAQLKAHDSLGAKAKALVKKWKQIAKNGGGSSSSTSGSADTTPAKPAPKKAERRPSVEEEPPADFATELIGLAPFRQNICKKFFEIFQTAKGDLVKAGVNEEAIGHLLGPRALELEACISKQFPEKRAYSDKGRSLFFNMKKNRALTQEVILGQLEVETLVNMKSEDLAADETRKARAEEAKKLNDSRRLDWEQANEQKINEMCGIKGDLLAASLFTCGRCKSTKTTSTQKQTRSADEPMTVFVLCLNCGKRWKC